MKRKLPLILLVVIFSIGYVNGKEKSGNSSLNSISQILVVGCNPSQSHADLDIGNVRTAIWINGDMWWDLTGTSLYEVPKGSGKHSLNSGALWIGGKDGAGNLKVAAQTYRQSGSDFWPGPIDTTTSTITLGQCLYYDRHWKITRQEVFDFINGGSPSQVIVEWPGNGNPAFGEDHFLAPFFDHSGDGVYDINDGDYPKYDFGTLPPGVNNKLNGDQTIWWVFNDVGNIHSETNSLLPIGLEIRAQAYAFCTSDTDLTNTTFYSYELIHRGNSILNEAYIGQFTDVELGNYLDDYVGCDVGRNLGYGYNGDSNDEGVLGYGTELPAVGIDLLQGPTTDSITMNKFVYYNNDATNLGNPLTAQHYYNYLDGKWKDNSPLVYGGTGYQTAGAPLSNYMFPGSSDPQHIGTNGVDPGFDWTESLPCPTCSPNSPGDRRFLMSSGKLTMYPGQVFHFTKAAVWARKTGGVDSSVAALKRADDRIQNFFDSNFSSIPTCTLTIGINEIQQIRHSVFPNPATEFFVIKLKQETKKIFLKVFSDDGKLIYQSNESNSDEINVSTSDWSAGVYYYLLTDGNKGRATGKMSVLK